MTLSARAQWTLVASGLIAHADAVMAGEECERLMTMLDEQAEGDAYGEWLGVVSDPARLEQLLGELPELPAEHHREVLESAWVMAIADGRRVPEEEAMLERIADELGVERVQLDFWREAWSTAQDDMAAAAAHALRHVLGPDPALAPDDRAWLVERVQALPTTDDHKSALARALGQPCAAEDVAQELHALALPRRKAALRIVATAVALRGREADPAARLVALAAACGVSAMDVDAWLEGS